MTTRSAKSLYSQLLAIHQAKLKEFSDLSGGGPVGALGAFMCDTVEEVAQAMLKSERAIDELDKKIAAMKAGLPEIDRIAKKYSLTNP